MDDDKEAQEYAERCLAWLHGFYRRLLALDKEIGGEGPEDAPDIHLAKVDTLREIGLTLGSIAGVCFCNGQAMYSWASDVEAGRP